MYRAKVRTMEHANVHPAAQIVVMFAATEGYVHAFDDTGFAALDPKWSGSRPVSSVRSLVS